MRESYKPLQIYIVEDSPILQRLLTSSIEASGAELAGCSGSAQKAISDLSLLQPDLIMIDISLHSGSGFDVLRVLQERRLVHDAIKVVLTNHANAEYRNLSYRLGANHFFDKTETSQVLALIDALATERRRGGGGPRNPGNDTRGNRRGEVVDTSRPGTPTGSSST
jgi:DNA-binding NarL/FixJ family response regulator